MPREVLWKRLEEFEPRLRGRLMSRAAWLWKTGLHDIDVIMAILAQTSSVRNFFAYFAPGGSARECLNTKIAGARLKNESDQFKKMERSFAESLLESDSEVAKTPPSLLVPSSSSSVSFKRPKGAKRAKRVRQAFVT